MNPTPNLRTNRESEPPRTWAISSGVSIFTPADPCLRLSAGISKYCLESQHVITEKAAFKPSTALDDFMLLSYTLHDGLTREDLC